MVTLVVLHVGRVHVSAGMRARRGPAHLVLNLPVHAPITGSRHVAGIAPAGHRYSRPSTSWVLVHSTVPAERARQFGYDRLTVGARYPLHMASHGSRRDVHWSSCSTRWVPSRTPTTSGGAANRRSAGARADRAAYYDAGDETGCSPSRTPPRRGWASSAPARACPKPAEERDVAGEADRDVTRPFIRSGDTTGCVRFATIDARKPPGQARAAQRSIKIPRSARSRGWEEATVS